VGTPGQPPPTWRHALAPAAGFGTAVTESFRLANTAALRSYWFFLGRLRGRTNRNGMRRTLEAIKAELEGAA
jgi:hypothetical protein